MTENVTQGRKSDDGTGFTAAHNFGFRRDVFNNHFGLTGPPEQALPHRFTCGRKLTQFQRRRFLLYILYEAEKDALCADRVLSLRHPSVT
jgi:hypothetical protein